jgi:cobaltochelatase CobS
MTDMIKCEICGAEEHVIQTHLKNFHPEMTVTQYREKFPVAPLMSEKAMKMFAEAKAKKEAKTKAEAAAATATAAPQEDAKPATVENKSALTGLASAEKDVMIKRSFHEIFNLTGKESKSASGKPIPITCIENSSSPEMVPEMNDTYVYDASELKDVMIALELNINPYVWGHKGSGKSELFEQVAARTGRPFVRIQHTSNTEESHIVGMWTVKKGETIFELGPLATAMKNGWLYLADEYDFALPSVLSVYQAVLEGKPLMIKEADEANRIIKPHPNFRFAATGNTNGSGDETGLYQGTNLQNSANYDRFGSVIYKSYMSKKDESEILQRRTGLVKEDADKLVDFATLVRNAYDGKKICDTVSPRSLINAARIGLCRSSFPHGIQLAFSNKLTRVDKEVVDGLSQRVFGS